MFKKWLLKEKSSSYKGEIATKSILESLRGIISWHTIIRAIFLLESEKSCWEENPLYAKNFEKISKNHEILQSFKGKKSKNI